jgi:uncharacterized membrane protein
MTITLPLDLIAAFATEHPWAAVTLVFFLGVVLPAIWSTRSWRRRAAMAVIRILVDACAAVAAIATHGVNSPRQAASRGPYIRTGQD